MMGPTHAVCGSALWLVAAPAVTTATGHHLTPTQMLVGAACSAGAALWPDIAKTGSTIARSFGPFTEVIAHVVNAVAMAVFAATRTRRDNPTPRDAHRLLTHTFVWCAASAAVVAPLVAWGGKWAALGLLFFLLGLAIRGLMADWAKSQGWLGVAAASAAAAYVAAQHMPRDNYWWLALAVLLGSVSHAGFADLITKEGTPFAWPLTIRGKRWYDIAPPSWLRITTGGAIEYGVYFPLFTVVSLLGVVAAFTGWGNVWSTLSSIVG